MRWILFVFVTGYISCNKYSEKWEDLPYIEVVDSLTIYLDSKTPPICYCPYIVEFQDEPKLVFQNSLEFTLKIHSLSSGKLEKTTSFLNSGPNGLGPYTSSMYLNEDTLIYLDKKGNLSLLNGNAEIINTVDLNEYNEKGDPYFCINYLPLIQTKNRFIIPDYFQASVDNHLFFYLRDFDRPISKIKIPESHIIGYFGFDVLWHWNYAYNKNNSNIYFNSPVLDSIYIYDDDFELVDKKKVRSSVKEKDLKKLFSFGSYLELKNSNWSYEEALTKLKSYFLYGQILRDETNDQYFRFTKLPIQNKYLRSKDPVLAEIRRETIMILDHNLDLIKELRIPFNKYILYENCLFVYDGKLYLQRYGSKEDIVIFDVIKTNY